MDKMTSNRKIIEPSQSQQQKSQKIGGDDTFDGKIAGLYDLEETLGSGHFAVVKKARHVFTGAEVAVKVVDKTKLDEVSKAHLFQEVRCMKLVQHPNVVRLYEVIDTQTKLYLVLELGDGGDLYDYIMKHEHGLNEDLARKYFCQILRAIRYCHQLHVVHRDLKPENVVFFEKLGIVKLTDFGFSNKFSPGQKLETFCGSLAYSAPEILLGDSYDAPAVDIWSLGVILYMLVCGKTPFDKANDSETLTMIMDCKYTVPPQVSAGCRELISSMLVRDPNGRSTLEQIANFPWVKQNSLYDTSDVLPLISRQELSEENHNFILQKMINGNIASKEEILNVLDKNTYNHITATYFLLAEMRLRKQREEQIKSQRLKASLSAASTNNATKVLTAPEIVLPPSPIETTLTELKPEKRSRKCSVVREEEEDDSSREMTDSMDKLKVSTRRESISDGRLNQSVHEHNNPSCQIHNRHTTTTTVPTTASLSKKHPSPLNKHPVVKEETSTTPPDVQSQHRSIRDPKDLELGKIKHYGAGSNKHTVLHRRTKFNKVRTPSCSSSEASDDDTKSRNKKKMEKLIDDAPIRFQMHRRDSHDDSSDSQDPNIPSAGTQGHTANLLSKCDTKNSKNQQKQKNNNSSEDKSQSQNTKTQQLKTNGDVSISLQPNSKKSLRRQRIRAYSLDRITEAQENELRQRSYGETHMEQICTLCSLYTLSGDTTETKSSRKPDIKLANNTASLCLDCTKRSNNAMQKIAFKNESDGENITSLELLPLKNYSNNNTLSINSDEINLILEDQKLRKTICITGSKSFVIKKVCRLGKYFSDINFS